MIWLFAFLFLFFGQPLFAMGCVCLGAWLEWGR